MNGIDHITIGLIGPIIFAIGAGILFLPLWLMDRRLIAKASMSERKMEIIHRRLVEKYRKENHDNPHVAASNHTSMLVHVERFRRYACEEFAVGREIDDIKQDWLKENGRRIQEVHAVGADRSEGIRYFKTLADMIASTPEDEIFIYGDAARIWQERKELEDAEIAAFEKRHEDPCLSHVLDSLWGTGLKF